MTLWLNKAKGKLFSLSVSPLLFSCLYIFNFHLGLSGFLYLFFPCFFQNIPFFIHSFISSVSLHFSGLQSLLTVSVLLYFPYSTSLISLNYSFMCPLMQSLSMFPGCLLNGSPVLAGGIPKEPHCSGSDTDKQIRTEWPVLSRGASLGWLWPLSHPINISWITEWMVNFYIPWLFSVVMFICLVLIYKM